jgi:hypothetical protein
MSIQRIAAVSMVLVFFLGSPARSDDSAGTTIEFKKTQLDGKFRSEGVAVGDFNKDGRNDIAAGFVWYEGPDWKMHAIIDKPPSQHPASMLLGTPLYFEPKKYSNSFCNFAEDLNGDGWLDLIVIDFPGTPTWWFENPKQSDAPWTQHLVTPVTNNESPLYVDLDGDGRRDLVAGVCPDETNADSPDRRMAYMTRDADPFKPWTIHRISTKAAPGTRKYSHGLGVGDVNGDGRNDILCASGWWEAPPGYPEGEWEFHAVQFGENEQNDKVNDTGKAAHLCVYDFDGDGDADVLASSPHAYGIWWHEQLPDGAWQAHEIDSSFSQTHAVCLADLNGDSLPDFVTGKRWWAHAAGDPGVDEPAVFCWFELTRKNGRPVWTRHQFDQDSGVGTQFEVADVNNDDLLDIVVSSKKGVHYFQQHRQ